MDRDPSLWEEGYRNAINYESSSAVPDNQLSFLLLNIALSLVTFVFFILPAKFSLLRYQTQLNALSGGLLVSIVLFIILPEGFATYFRNKEELSRENEPAVALLFGYGLQLFLDVGAQALGGRKDRYHGIKHSPVPLVDRSDTEEGNKMEDSRREGSKDEEEEEDIESGGRGVGGREQGIHGSYTSDSETGIELTEAQTSVDEGGLRTSDSSHAQSLSSSSSVIGGFSSDFLGLLIHCMADGIALGASFLSSSSSLRWSVFITLTLHKIPISFATGTLIWTQHLSKALFLRHALLFVVMSPFAAILTHSTLLLLLQWRSTSTSSTTRFVALSLLFSAGTFLYVSVGHIIPSLLHSTAFKRPPHRGMALFSLSLGLFAFPLLFLIIIGSGHHTH